MYFGKSFGMPVACALYNHSSSSLPLSLLALLVTASIVDLKSPSPADSSNNMIRLQAYVVVPFLLPWKHLSPHLMTFLSYDIL